MAIQNHVNLFRPNCEAPRRGNRTTEGIHGYNICSCNAIQQAPPREHARVIWNSLGLIPNNRRNHPTSPMEAEAYAMIGDIAGVQIPDTIIAEMGGPLREELCPVQYHISPGGCIFQGKMHATKFIVFVYANMDDGDRVPWPELTGREQYEWYEAWRRCDKGYVRREEQTRGLKGTNILGRVPNMATLRAAMPDSPSLARRRPAAHPIPQGAWENVARSIPAARQLFD
jgi:hypothetical protein